MVMPVNVYGMISTRLFATANTTRWEWTVKLVNLSTMLDLGAEPLQRMLTSVYPVIVMANLQNATLTLSFIEPQDKVVTAATVLRTLTVPTVRGAGTISTARLQMLRAYPAIVAQWVLLAHIVISMVVAAVSQE